MTNQTQLSLSSVSGLVIAVALGVGPLAALAQVGATAAPPAASAPPPLKTTPRPLTPSEKRDSATVPGDVRPADAVIPQINLPIGRTPPVNPPTRAEAQRQSQARANGGVDDGVARCKAETTAAARRECLDIQSRVGKKP